MIELSTQLFFFQARVLANGIAHCTRYPNSTVIYQFFVLLKTMKDKVFGLTLTTWTVSCFFCLHARYGQRKEIPSLSRIHLNYG